MYKGFWSDCCAVYVMDTVTPGEINGLLLRGRTGTAFFHFPLAKDAALCYIVRVHENMKIKDS